MSTLMNLVEKWRALPDMTLSEMGLRAYRQRCECANELEAALRAAETGQAWQPATADEQEPLVERLAVMLFEVFEEFHPPTREPGETVEHYAQRVRAAALDNIRAALRQVLVVAPTTPRARPHETGDDQ